MNINNEIISEHNNCENMKNTKVIVIGLDGATWNLIKPWVDNGELPTFKYLMENGSWGILESTIPPISPSAWVSIYTGCKPSKHGIFGFLKQKKDSYFYRPISSKDIKKPTIWEILSEFGLRSIVINALFMYPPKPINGILITGLGTPSKDGNFVYPKSYKEFIVKNFPKYDIDFNEDLIITSNSIDEFVNKIEEITLEQIKLTKYFIKNEDWNFLFSIFRALDVIQHYFWDNYDIIFKFYKIFDDFLGDLIKNELKNDNFIMFVISDHGFTHVKKYFCVNNWLEQIGVLKTIKQRKSFLITAETIKKLLLKLGMRNLVWKLKRSEILEKILKIIPSEEFDYIYKIDWRKTKAYYLEGSDGIININLMGREPLGIVSNKEYDKIIQYITNNLENIKDPETGKNIIKKVYTKEKLFNTNNKNLPDIFILLEDEYRAVAYNKIDNKSLFMPPIHGKVLRPGDHNINGVFIAYGWNIRKKQLKKRIKLWDIAPTILKIFEISTMSYMDGQVLKEIFQNFDVFCSKSELSNVKTRLEKEKIKEKVRKLKIFKKYGGVL